MRFGFVTCVQLGLSCIEEIYRVGGRLDLVVTLKDDLARKKSGRVYVDDVCRTHRIDLVKIRHINDPDSLAALREAALDWLVIIGWSQIAGPEVLQLLRQGAFGMHPTLLPQGRGRAAIPWAILKALPETGVTLFQLDEGVDTGPIIAQKVLPIAPDETATTLYERVADAHRSLIGRVWPDLPSGNVQRRTQDESQATIWPGRTPADGEITPEMTVAGVERLVRATTHPYPGAFWKSESEVIRIWAGRPGSGLTPAAGAYRLRLVDGVYDAVTYEAEQVAAGTTGIG